MGHAITYNSVTEKYEVMTRGAAWHHLGQVVENAQTWQDTVKLAGLDWTLSKRQLDYNGINVPAWALFRDDQPDVDKAFIASTTETYQPIQNGFMFDFLDTLVEADGKAIYEAAGSLHNGAQVWALVNIGAAFDIVGGDHFESYLLFTDDRTGKRAAKCFLTTVRVVCANTLANALNAEDVAASVQFRHNRTIQDKMTEAVGMLSGARLGIDQLKAKLERLADRTLTKETLTAVLDRLFPAKTQEELNSKQREGKLLDILKLYENNDYNAFPEVRGTAYNLFNALTEYTDHFAAVRRTPGRMGQTDDQIRSERALLGDGAGFKLAALDAILAETANAPTRRKAYSMPSDNDVLNAGVIE